MRKTKQRAFRFHVKCNAAQTYCARITRKRETSEVEAIVRICGATVQQKENGVRAHKRCLVVFHKTKEK